MKPTLVFATACLLLAGCSSTPAPRFHSLLSASGATARDTSAPPLALELSSVSVPAAVDQTQWVMRLPDDSLRILEQEQWVAPLRDELRAALFERLSQRFGAVDARSAPASPAWRVKVDVQRFESIVGKEVWLDSTWSASPPAHAGNPLVCRSNLREPAVGDLSAIAAAHGRAVIRLADEIGSRLQALRRGEAPGCGP